MGMKIRRGACGRCVWCVSGGEHDVCVLVGDARCAFEGGLRCVWRMCTREV